MCIFGGNGRAARVCEHYEYCKRIEPTGALLPCERDIADIGTAPQCDKSAILLQHYESGDTLTVPDFAEILGLSISTSRKYINRMVRNEILERAGTLNKRYLFEVV